MPSTTAATAPLSDYEALSTSWAAACTARGTDLRGESLVNRDVLGQVQVPAATGILGEASAAELPLDGAAEPEPVPPPEKDPVHLPSLSPKMPTGGRILDPVPVRKHHGERVTGTLEIDNPDAEFLGALTRFISRQLSEVETMCGVTDMHCALTEASHRRSTIRTVGHRSAAASATERAPHLLPHGRSFRRGDLG
jgi:hypothetical protein